MVIETRNPFIDVIEAPDLGTKIVAKDGDDAAGYVTVSDVIEVPFEDTIVGQALDTKLLAKAGTDPVGYVTVEDVLGVPIEATGGSEARSLADWLSMLEGTTRIRMAGYVPEYNMDGTQVEDSGDALSGQIVIDLGDFTLPAGASKQHAFMSWKGTVRSAEATAEQEGLKVLRFQLNSDNADAYFIQGAIILSGGTGVGKDVKAIYGRASLDENAIGAVFGLVGGITIPTSATPNANSAALQLTVDGDKVGSGNAIYIGSSEATRNIRRGLFFETSLTFAEAVLEASAGSTGRLPPLDGFWRQSLPRAQHRHDACVAERERDRRQLPGAEQHGPCARDRQCHRTSV